MLDIEKIISQAKPMLGQETIATMERIVHRKMSVLEFGAGGSTIWFASRVKRLFTVEGNSVFAMAVIRELGIRGLHNTVVFYMPKRPIFTIMIPPNTFDFVLIDGKKRLACAHIGAASLKPGGWILLDNSETEKNRPCLEYLNSLGWPKAITRGYKPKVGAKATFWQKPKEEKK